MPRNKKRKVRFGSLAALRHLISSTTASGGKADVKIAGNTNSGLPLSADTVEKLRFEISGDFICVLSVILYSRYERGYEGVVEVR